MRRAKIVCTLGPATSTPEAVRAVVDAGMDCARLNFSHGDHDSHQRAAKLVREAAAAARRPVAILADLCGPKMRVGRFGGGSVELARGQTFRLTTDEVTGDAKRVSVTYAQLADDVKPGDRVLLDDGLIEMRVTGVEGRDVVCEVEVGGTLSDKKGLNLPGARLSTPSMTDKDRADLAFAVDTIGVDYAALSFVRTPDDVREAQRLAKGTPVIAKMEKPEAIENLEAIADVAEGLMVARGDLGVELGSEKVPLVQKRIIREVNRRGKIVITATQMLDSMIRNPRPTRAEATDVANAVLDGTDALMLSGETASGKYPVESVKMMSTIVQEVEREMLGDGSARTGHIDRALLEEWGEWGVSNAAARAAALLSYALPLKVIVVFSHGGTTARLLSEYRPRAPIIAVTPDAKVASRLALEWGVVPYVEVPPDDTQETLRIATALLVREKHAASGDIFGLVCGWPASSRPNTVKLHRL
jgi:pyruvate kinase